MPSEAQEKERNMKTRRPLFIVALALLGGIVGLVGGSTPALAVVSIASAGTTKIPYGGIVKGAPEPVLLMGFVQIETVVVRDPDFGTPPVVRLSIDFSRVSGIGLKSGTKYVTSGRQDLLRPLVATDVVDVTFAIHPSSPTGFTLARPALASFTLDYNVRNEAFDSGTASGSVNVTDSLPAQ
jgi:hypothetical protein